MIYKEDMTMILSEDLNKNLSKYENKIYSFVKKKSDDFDDSFNDSFNELKESIMNELNIFYELSNKTDNLSLAKKKYLHDFIHFYFKDKIIEFSERIQNRKNILEKLEKLKELKLPEQRSKEWYELREKILTASSLADSIGEGHFSTKEKLLIQKCGGPRDKVPFEIVEWGVMYEPVATKFYELINNLTVLEFGLVPHPEFKIFGASPDGICDIDSPDDYIGRMLEIKCPPKRQFTDEVPRHYWIQMQGQLEACNLEECDFLQVKITEYLNETDYNEDKFIENDRIKEGYSSLDLPKGLVISFIKDNKEGDPTIEYEYCEFYQSYDNLIEWSEKIIQKYKDENKIFNRIQKHWWKIERYECNLVGRDRKWWLSVQPKIIDFWEDVLHYREVGIQELLDKKAAKKIKKIKIKKDKKSSPKKNIFEIDKAVVEKIQNDYLIDSD
tara:strand:+ start:526 stop:1851 length:1326 start_codon:yes stop_codon:yes gene_type:complete